MWMEDLLSIAIANGIWATLFVYLFLSTQRESRDREAHYRETIHELSKALKGYCEVVSSVEDFRRFSTDIHHRMERQIEHIYAYMRDGRARDYPKVPPREDDHRDD